MNGPLVWQRSSFCGTNACIEVLPGQAPVMISAKAERMADLGLLREPAASLRWELTPAGRELLRGAS